MRWMLLALLAASCGRLPEPPGQVQAFCDATAEDRTELAEGGGEGVSDQKVVPLARLIGNADALCK